MRSLAERREVEKLLARGASDYAIAAITGVPRSTVGNWRRHPDRGPREAPPAEEWRPPDPQAYAYLLGLYLGDGCLSPAGSPLMIALDARYPGIVGAAEAAIEATMPGIAVHRYRPKENLVRVVASTPLWRRAFPQHGPGRKHTPTDQAGRVAAGDHPRLAEAASTRANPFRRLQNDQPVQGQAAQRSGRRIRISALLLLEHVRRHPSDLLRPLRATWDSLDAVESAEHLDLAPQVGRSARRVHRAEVVSCIQVGCGRTFHRGRRRWRWDHRAFDRLCAQAARR